MVATNVCQLFRDEYLGWSWVSAQAESRCRSAYCETPQGPVATPESEYLKVRDGCHVKPLREEHYPLLESEIHKWSKQAAMFEGLHAASLKVFANRGINATPDFELWFTTIRAKVGTQDFAGREIECYRQCFWHLKGLSNIEWSRCFSALLPQAVPHRRAEIASMGRQMCRVLYLELVGKALDARSNGEKSWDMSVFDRLDMFARIADEMVAGTWCPVP
jgi:hypothetical protein